MTETTLRLSQSNERVLDVAWRWVLVLVGAGSFAAFIAANVGTVDDTAVNLATTGVAASAVVAFLADLIALFRICWRHIKGEDAKNLKDATPSFWKAWATLTTIIMAANAWLRPADPPAIRPDPWFVVYSAGQSAEPPVVARRAMFPVLYANSADHTTWVKGVSFTKEEIDVSVNALDRIFAGYQACGSVSDQPPVQLEIVGYASSKEFDGVERPQSNILNVEAANRRAWEAYCFVADRAEVQLANGDQWRNRKCAKPLRPQQGTRPEVIVTVNRWSEDQEGFQKMTQASPLNDRPPGIPKEERDPEELNRRVDFNVIHAGACQKTSALSPQVVAAAR
jgi:hypothetical protein